MEISIPSLLKKYYALTSFRFIEFFFFCFAALILVNEWFIAYQLKFVPDIFDDSIKIVSGLYTVFKFTPYTDFAIVYPPGLLILSKLFSLNFVSRFHFFAIAYLLFALPIIAVIAWKSRSWFITGATVLVMAFSINITGDWFVHSAWFALFLSSYIYLEKGNVLAKRIVPIAVFVLFLLKWERVVIFGVLMAVGWTITHRAVGEHSKRFLSLCKATLIASLSSSIFLVFYLLINRSDIPTAFYFIFSVPLKILPYRKLPLPSLIPLEASLLSIEYAVYFSCFILLLLAVLVSRRILKDQKYEYLLLLMMPVAIIPYAMGRADSIHAFPLLITTFFSLILLSITEKRAISLLVVFVVYFVVNYNLFNYKISNIFQKTNTYVDVVDQSLKDCRLATRNLKYNSLFVGRTDYSQYIYSHVMMYLLNPTVKPATKYISDEPGLQNNCEDGELIANDLTKAEKPMLSFLETQPQPTEKNMSEYMVSCGYIEKWLVSNKSKKVGTCTHFGKEFEIRLYK